MATNAWIAWITAVERLLIAALPEDAATSKEVYDELSEPFYFEFRDGVRPEVAAKRVLDGLRKRGLLPKE
jgi:hypothetical protein